VLGKAGEAVSNGGLLGKGFPVYAHHLFDDVPADRAGRTRLDRRGQRHASMRDGKGTEGRG
jgi:hypothetical protein